MQQVSRTPPKRSAQDNKVTINYPTQRLGAVTRKKHDLQNYIDSNDVNLETFNVLFNDYNIKVNNFHEECKVYTEDESLAATTTYREFHSWFHHHYDQMKDFVEKMENYKTSIRTNEELGPDDSASNATEKSSMTKRSSRSSQLSAMKLKLIEEKALHQANVEALRRKKELDEARIQLDYDLQQTELQKKATYHALLEKGLREYDEKRSSISGRKTKLSRKDCLKSSTQDRSSVNQLDDKNTKWCSNQTPPIIPKPEEENLQSQIAATMLLVAKNQVKASLPKNEPKNFDGSDPTMFQSFMLDFMSMIADHCDLDSDRLHYLEKYTSGLPLQLVKSCRSGDASLGYKKALFLLHQEFGNERNIAGAYIAKLNEWRPIKNEDGKSLREFSIFLMSIDNMISNFSTLNQLNSPTEIYKSVMKLPFKLRDRWRNKVQQIQYASRLENFHDFTAFVRDQSQLMNMPLYCNISDRKTEVTDIKKSTDSKRKIFATSLDTDKEKCLVCKKSNHNVFNCFFFKRKSHEEKTKFVRDRNLCFSCLGESHVSKNCQNKKKCSICDYSHPTIMHRHKEEKKNKVSETSKNKPIEDHCIAEETSQLVEEETATKVMVTAHKESVRKVHPAVPVKVRIQGSTIIKQTYMGIDPFCSDAFMSQKLSDQFGLKGFEAMVPMTTMHNKGLSTKTRVINNLEILDLDENEYSLIPVVYTQASWPFDKEDSPLQSDVDKCPYMKDIPFQFIDEDIGLLVGLNQSHITRPLQVIEGPNENSPYATLHKFGWAFNGVLGKSTPPSMKCFRVKIEDNDDINTTFQKFCNKDFVDVSPGILAPSVEDTIWEEKVKKSYFKRPDNKYEVALPFKEDNLQLPNNREQVLGRLNSSKKRLKTDEVFYKEYRDFMSVMLQNKFAEEIPDNELDFEQGKAWYLFHFGVRHKHKKKIRIVFDASLKYKGISLNDSLLQGPDLTNGLLGVLLRFREHGIAITADIEKMFYAVKVSEEHKNYLRFFWFPDGNLDATPAEYRVTVHIFGAISSPSVANFVLRQSALNPEAQTFSIEARKSVEKEFYVDDWMKSTDSASHASALIVEVTEMLAQSGFNLTSFSSNDRKVLGKIEQVKLNKSLREIDLDYDDLPCDRALGVFWNIEEDSFGFKVNLPDKINSKRGVLSTFFSVYDPLGMAAPVVLPAKKIFQAACNALLNWDDQLPPSMIDAWNDWKKSILKLEEYRFPRSIQPSCNIGSIDIHLFCDGSEKAYAAVAYLCFASVDGEKYCSLIMTKSRVVPLKGTAVATIPRIELNAAKLAVQLYQVLKEELTVNFERSFFWTDSSTVLKYLNSETRRFQRFIANRVSFIKENSILKNWKHVPTALNPADLASRGTTAAQLIGSDMWIHGPGFLREDEDEWPKSDFVGPVLENDPELVKSKKVFATRSTELNPTDLLLHSSSSWYQTKLRVTWLLRVRKGLKTKIWNETNISINELNEAETSIWRYIQLKVYSTTFECLQKGKVLSKKKNILKLNPFIGSDGLLRVGGRIHNAKVSYNTRHPIILPKDHYLVKLLVRNVHKTLGHMGKECVITQLKQQYWIIGVNTLTRTVVRECIACRKRQSQPSEQLMGDLPEDRVSADLPVFSQVGIDAFGPFYVVRGRANIKRYGLIFSCLSSRAVHLEVLFTLETSSFINALRRFSARRGYPALIRSDNGTNFVGAEKELQQEIIKWNNKQTETLMLQNNIEWKFQPPSASHFGGCWEREIRTIRKVLSGLTNEQPLKLNDEELSTLLCEVESILNSRPLTSLSDDPDDLEPLTPNHILLARSGLSFPPGLFNRDDLYVRRKWKQIQYLANVFWFRWKKEYLPLLQERNKWQTKKRSHEVGDLVLLVDQLLPRNQWSLGRITEVYKDRNNHVRVANVKVNKVKGELKDRPVVLRRPITKLILLRPASDI